MPTDPISAGIKKAGIVGAQRHFFLCMGPDCCTREEAEVVWEYVKKRVKETGLPVMRTKAECFRICSGGPWFVVYPDGDADECHVLPPVARLSPRYRDAVLREADRVAVTESSQIDPGPAA